MIRVAVETDRDALVALQLASWRSSYSEILPHDYMGAPLAADLRAKWAARPLGHPVLTLVAGEMEGFVCCLLDQTPPYIDNLHVAPALRGQGIGQALMLDLFRRLRDLGQSTCALTVLAENTGARRFYSSLSGTESAPRQARLMGHPITEVPVRFEL